MFLVSSVGASAFLFTGCGTSQNQEENKGDNSDEIISTADSNYWYNSTVSGGASYVEPFNSGGTGTQSDPYLITTAGQLAFMGYVCELDSSMARKYYALANDIDLSAHLWRPVGLVNIFTGSFDGRGHVISGLTCRISSFTDSNYKGSGSKYYAGLFGYAKATIKNLVLRDIRITTSTNFSTSSSAQWFIGGIVGYADANSELNKVGIISGQITYGVSSFTSTASYFCIGGLCGRIYSSTTISECFASISLTTGTGFKNTGKFQSIYAGGLVALAETREDANELIEIKNSYFYGHIDVYGAGFCGGIVGGAYNEVTIANCYFHDTATAWLGCWYAGGIVGDMESINGGYGDYVGIWSCFTDAKISLNSNTNVSSTNVGALAGNIYGYTGISSSCWESTAMSLGVGYDNCLGIGTNSYKGKALAVSALGSAFYTNSLYLASNASPYKWDIAPGETSTTDDILSFSQYTWTKYCLESTNLNGGYPVLTWALKCVSAKQYTNKGEVVSDVKIGLLKGTYDYATTSSTASTSLMGLIGQNITVYAPATTSDGNWELKEYRWAKNMIDSPTNSSVIINSTNATSFNTYVRASGITSKTTGSVGSSFPSCDFHSVYYAFYEASKVSVQINMKDEDASDLSGGEYRIRYTADKTSKTETVTETGLFKNIQVDYGSSITIDNIKTPDGNKMDHIRFNNQIIQETSAGTYVISNVVNASNQIQLRTLYARVLVDFNAKNCMVGEDLKYGDVMPATANLEFSRTDYVDDMHHGVGMTLTVTKGESGYTHFIIGNVPDEIFSAGEKIKWTVDIKANKAMEFQILAGVTGTYTKINITTSFQTFSGEFTQKSSSHLQRLSLLTYNGLSVGTEITIENLSIQKASELGDLPAMPSRVVRVMDGYYGILPNLDLEEGTVFGGWWSQPNGLGAKITENTPLVFNSNHVIYANINHFSENELKYEETETKIDKSRTWTRASDINDGYPFLTWSADAIKNKTKGFQYPGQMPSTYWDPNNYADVDFASDENGNVGNGTENSPYLIANVDQLLHLAYMVNVQKNSCSGKYFKLIDDINIRDNCWIPIGSSSNTFKGNFDGNGFSIIGLSMWASGADYNYYFDGGKYNSGFFGNASSAYIHDLYFEEVRCMVPTPGANLTSEFNFGVLVGSISKTRVERVGVLSGVFCDSINYANFNPNSFTFGGLIGHSSDSSIISQCFNYVAIENSSISTTKMDWGMFGGLVGCTSDSVISDCYNMGDMNVYNAGYCGGIVGYQSWSETSKCYYHAGFASGQNLPSQHFGEYCGGGIVGYLNAPKGDKILSCWTDAEVNMTPTSNGVKAGGILGGAYSTALQYVAGNSWDKNKISIGFGEVGEDGIDNNNPFVGSLPITGSIGAFYLSDQYLKAGENAAVWDIYDATVKLYYFEDGEYPQDSADDILPLDGHLVASQYVKGYDPKTGYLTIDVSEDWLYEAEIARWYVGKDIDALEKDHVYSLQSSIIESTVNEHGQNNGLHLETSGGSGSGINGMQGNANLSVSQQNVECDYIALQLIGMWDDGLHFKGTIKVTIKRNRTLELNRAQSSGSLTEANSIKYLDEDKNGNLVERETKVYEYKGKKYAKVTPDTNGDEFYNYYSWFKVQPIKWKVDEETWNEYKTFKRNFTAVSANILGFGAVTATNAKEGWNYARTDYVDLTNVNTRGSEMFDHVKTSSANMGLKYATSTEVGFDKFAQAGTQNVVETVKQTYEGVRVASVEEIEEVGGTKARISDYAACIWSNGYLPDYGAKVLGGSYANYWTRSLGNYVNSGKSVSRMGTVSDTWLQNPMGVRFALTMKDGINLESWKDGHYKVEITNLDGASGHVLVTHSDGTTENFTEISNGKIALNLRWDDEIEIVNLEKEGYANGAYVDGKIANFIVSGGSEGFCVGDEKGWQTANLENGEGTVLGNKFKNLRTSDGLCKIKVLWGEKTHIRGQDVDCGSRDNANMTITYTAADGVYTLFNTVNSGDPFATVDGQYAYLEGGKTYLIHANASSPAGPALVKFYFAINGSYSEENSVEFVDGENLKMFTAKYSGEYWLRFDNDSTHYKDGTSTVSDLWICEADYLPEQYTLLDYVENTATGNQIDTGFMPTVNTEVVSDFQFTKIVDNQYLFGVRKGMSLCFGSDSKKFTYGCQTSTNVEYLFRDVDTKRHKFSIKRGSYMFDDEKGTPTAELTTNATDKLWLFGENSRSTTCYARIYSTQIIDNGTLVRSFVPVFDSETGKAGLYDYVGKKFYTTINSSGSLVRGTDDSTLIEASKLNSLQSSMDGILIKDVNSETGNLRYTINDTSSEEYNWFKAQAYDVNKSYMHELFKTTKTGEYLISFSKTDEMRYLKLSFNGKKLHDAGVFFDVSALSNGKHTVKFILRDLQAKSGQFELVGDLSGAGGNLVKNPSFQNAISGYNPGWDTSLNTAYDVPYWSTANMGVPNPSTGYHAHITTGDNNHGNVMKLANMSPSAGRWIGTTQVITNLKPNTEYTIQFDAKTERDYPALTGGLQYTTTSTKTHDFHSGKFSFTLDSETWKTYTYSFTTSDDIDVTEEAHLCIYGHEGGTGIAWIDNVYMFETNAGGIEDSDEVITNYMEVNTVGGWETIGQEVAVEANSTYTITFDAQTHSSVNEILLQVCTVRPEGGDNLTTIIKQMSVARNYNGTMKMEFNTGSNTRVWIVLNCGGADDWQRLLYKFSNWTLRKGAVKVKSFKSNMHDWTKYAYGEAIEIFDSLPTYMTVHTVGGWEIIGQELQVEANATYTISVDVVAPSLSGMLKLQILTKEPEDGGNDSGSDCLAYTEIATLRNGNVSKTFNVGNRNKIWIVLNCGFLSDGYYYTFSFSNWTLKKGLQIVSEFKTNMYDWTKYGTGPKYIELDKNLYSPTNFKNGGEVEVDSSTDIITYNFTNNTSSIQYGNYKKLFSNDPYLQTNTQYTVVLEVFEISRSGNITICSPFEGGSSSNADVASGSVKFGLREPGIYSKVFTTASSFSGCEYDFRSYVMGIGPNDSINVKFRISVFYGTPRIGNDFAYKTRSGVYINDLPDDYERLDYIESSGSQYINTGIKPDNNTRVEISGQYTYMDPGIIYMMFGSRQSGKSLMMGKASSSNASLYGYCGSNFKTLNSWSTSDWFTQHNYVANNNDEFSVDSTSVLFSPEAFSVDQNMYLFALNDNGTKKFSSHMRMYYARILKDGKCVRDYIPCMRKSDGEVGMYDTISKTFFTNAGENKFVAGGGTF